jgi:hypothetical protein
MATLFIAEPQLQFLAPAPPATRTRCIQEPTRFGRDGLFYAMLARTPPANHNFP